MFSITFGCKIEKLGDDFYSVNLSSLFLQYKGVLLGWAKFVSSKNYRPYGSYVSLIIGIQKMEEPVCLQNLMDVPVYIITVASSSVAVVILVISITFFFTGFVLGTTMIKDLLKEHTKVKPIALIKFLFTTMFYQVMTHIRNQLSG